MNEQSTVKREEEEEEEEEEEGNYPVRIPGCRLPPLVMNGREAKKEREDEERKREKRKKWDDVRWYDMIVIMIVIIRS